MHCADDPCTTDFCPTHRPGMTDLMALSDAYEETCRANGRREMLWLMAVGLEMSCYLAQCSEHSMSEIWHGWLRDKALRALSARGDEQAAKLLKEQA